MRLPFISRRKADEAMCLLVEVSRRAIAEKDELIAEERDAVLQQGASRLRDRERDGRRLDRLRRGLAAERAQSAAYRREIRQLTDRLFDACGYQGEPLLPAARTALGIEDAKEADA